MIITTIYIALDKRSAIIKCFTKQANKVNKKAAIKSKIRYQVIETIE